MFIITTAANVNEKTHTMTTIGVIINLPDSLCLYMQQQNQIELRLATKHHKVTCTNYHLSNLVADTSVHSEKVGETTHNCFNVVNSRKCNNWMQMFQCNGCTRYWNRNVYCFLTKNQPKNKHFVQKLFTFNWQEHICHFHSLAQEFS